MMAERPREGNVRLSAHLRGGSLAKDAAERRIRCSRSRSYTESAVVIEHVDGGAGDELALVIAWIRNPAQGETAR